MKRTEVALFVNGQITRGLLEQHECSDCGMVTSGDADGTNSTLNFTNSTGGTFTVTNSALLFNDAYVTSGTLDAGTGVITFTNSSGGTFTVSGFQGFTSYWSSTAHNNIIASGDSNTHTMVPGTLGITGNTWVNGNLGVGMGTDTPTEPIEVKDFIKFNTTRGNSFYGPQSGRYVADNASTQYNTGIGKWALGSFNTYGTLDGALYNTAVGGLSQAYRTTGDYNTSVGQASMQAHTTSSWNTSVGYQAGFGVVHGGVGGNSYNTYIGANSGWYQTAQSGQDTYNTAVGFGSMYTSLGFYTTSIGALSQGSALAPAGCDRCTSVGYKTLYNSGTGGAGAEYNIAIGFQAGDNITTGAHNICIGNDADPPSATADYQMNIGGIIHGQDAYSDSAISQIGIGITTPKVKLDVHHNPTNLVNDTGGGEVVTFGAEHGSDVLGPGKLMYLNSSGVWRYADADINGKGADELLAIALGNSVSDGLLLRGFFDLVTELSGSFVKGGSCYVGTPAGQIQFTQPSGAGDFVRVVGYGTDTANVIYFNPDGTYITVA